jgi:hypothetical protein
MRKIAFLFVLLLLASPALVTNVSTCPILSVADTYVLNTSLTGAPNLDSGVSMCIILAASNIVLDCNGFSITNNGIGGTAAEPQKKRSRRPASDGRG